MIFPVVVFVILLIMPFVIWQMSPSEREYRTWRRKRLDLRQALRRDSKL